MTHWDDDDDDEDDGDEWEADVDEGGDTLSAAEQPDPSDTDRPDDGDDAVPCPFCRRSVHELADLCPGCGNFIGGDDDPAPRRPWWMIAGLVLCLIGAAAACFSRMW